MTKTTLAVLCAIGALMWVGIFYLAAFIIPQIDWPVAGQITTGALMLLFCVATTWESYLRWQTRYRERKRVEALRKAHEARVLELTLIHQRAVLRVTDMIASAPPEHRLQLQREAEVLGFFDHQPPKAA